MTGRLRVSRLTYAYPDGTMALRGISFDVAEGECVGIVGPNGAGKTTLVQVLAGVLAGFGGDVSVGGLPLRPENLDAIREQTGFIFHDPDDQLFMPTLADDVSFGPLCAGVPREEAARRTEAILRDTGIGHLAARFPGHLSAGQKRLAALAGVLVMEPRLLVLDEPTAFLDPRARRHLITRLAGLPQTRLVITHDLELVVELCARVIVLDEGRVVADGATAEVLSDEALMSAHGLEKPHILRHRHPH